MNTPMLMQAHDCRQLWDHGDEVVVVEGKVLEDEHGSMQHRAVTGYPGSIEQGEPATEAPLQSGMEVELVGLYHDVHM